MKYLQILGLCVLFAFTSLGCAVERDFGTIDNPCGNMQCKEHENGSAICFVACEDGYYAFEAHKLKQNPNNSKILTTKN